MGTGIGMIKFFCKICGKEIWIEFMKHFETFKMHTLEEVYSACTCDDCLALMKNTEQGGTHEQEVN